jgi:hypothetical protein
VSSDIHDLDDFPALWAEEPVEEERAELHGIARRVSLRATLFHYADLALGVAIALGALLAVVLQPAPVTLAVGIVAGGGLFWSSWRRHLLKKEIALLMQVSDRTDLLEIQTRRVTTDLHRSVIGLLATPPAIVLFALLSHSLVQGGSLAGFQDMLIRHFVNSLVGPMLVAAMLTLIYQQAQIVRRLRSELHRLRILSGQYREEARLDRMAVG